MDYTVDSKEQAKNREYLAKYLEMLEGSILMSLTAFKNIKKAKNLNAAKSIAITTIEGIERYAKAITKS
jgi:hypothetical protein